ncbi:Uncharacterized protein Fot_30968 [Forsythia ovata]|uniref:Uncharacterized protein n=1 Tax=Forsythia ovata TaxID=205694 RepID=A0ABD1T3N2_9LAMI
MLPLDLVVDNRSDLVKVVAACICSRKTYRDARGPIYDVSVADVHQAGHVDWPGSSSANETSIPKPSEYLFERHLYLYGEFAAHIVTPFVPPYTNQHNEHLQNDNIDTSPGEATADSSSTDHNSIPLVHVPFPNSPENVSSNNLAPRHSTRQKTKPAWMEDYITSVTESSIDSAADHLPTMESSQTNYQNSMDVLSLEGTKPTDPLREGNEPSSFSIL